MTQSASSDPIQVGDLVAGKYRVDRVLGEGGMGIVVAATHAQLDERVALKFLRPIVASNPEIVQRFIREARAAVKIRSEHVARVLDVGTLDSGTPYMVMEYLDGQDLAQTLAGRGPLPVGETVTYVLQACEAVAEAHSLGTVHRDLKPANLFLARRPNGRPVVKVLDFGISKVASAGDNAALTNASAMMGSPSYMSPEQMVAAGSVDVRADVWALGVVLYELLTGRLPFMAETMPELVGMILQSAYTPVAALRPDVPPGLQGTIDRCLQKDRTFRHANIAELAAGLVPFGPPRSDLSLERIAHVLGLTGGASHTVSASTAPAPHQGAQTFSPMISSKSGPTRRHLLLLVPAPLLVIAACAGLFFAWTRFEPPRLDRDGHRSGRRAGPGAQPDRRTSGASSNHRFDRDLRVRGAARSADPPRGAPAAPRRESHAGASTASGNDDAVRIGRPLRCPGVPHRELLRYRRESALSTGVSVRSGRFARGLLAPMMACAVGLLARPAHADEAECIAASEQALTLRQQGKLHDALQQLAICSAASCSSEVKAECTQRIDAIDAAMPTLVLGAKDGAGNDLYDVRVSMDAAPLASTLDGRPLSIDPGEHTFTFEAAGTAPVEKKLVLREGEKDRHESIMIGTPPPTPAVVPALPTPPPAAPAHAPLGTQKTLAIVGGASASSGWASVFGSASSRPRVRARRRAIARLRCAITARKPSRTTTPPKKTRWAPRSPSSRAAHCSPRARSSGSRRPPITGRPTPRGSASPRCSTPGAGVSSLAGSSDSCACRDPGSASSSSAWRARRAARSWTSRRRRRPTRGSPSTPRLSRT